MGCEHCSFKTDTGHSAATAESNDSVTVYEGMKELEGELVTISLK